MTILNQIYPHLKIHNQTRPGTSVSYGAARSLEFCLQERERQAERQRQFRDVFSRAFPGCNLLAVDELMEKLDF